ncbi:hypothetical protein BH09VER1_BH09VER1_50240 [soil metagenome]
MRSYLYTCFTYFMQRKNSGKTPRAVDRKGRWPMRVRSSLSVPNGEGGPLSEGRPRLVDGCKPDFVFSAHSRVRSDDHLSYLSRGRGIPLGGMRLIPGDIRLRGPARPSRSSCSVLHRNRVYRAPLLALGAVGSYPAFSPLPRSSCENRGGLIFCDTFRRTVLSFHAPPLSQGMLPCGVRTFLSQAHRSALESAVRHRLRV